MRRKEFTLTGFMILCFLFVAFPQRAEAQMNVPPAYYHGKGMDIANVKTITASTGETFIDGISNSEFASATRVLLYNVGKDMFLNAGGHWGVRSATFTEGLPLLLYKGKDYYDIRGPFKNNAKNGIGGKGSFLGFVNDDANTANNGVYFDRTNRDIPLYSDGTENKKKKCNHKWIFERVKDITDDYVYRIKINDVSNTNKDFYLCANQGMTVFVFQEGNNNLVKALTSSDIEDFNTNKYTYWKIVSDQQLIDEFEKTYENEVASNATFLLRAQGFNRTNIYNEYSDTYQVGWQVGKTTGSQIEYTTGYTNEGYNYTTEADLVSALNPKLGMFHCAAIRKGKKGDRLFQTVTLPESGWYSIECQGLYNDDNRKTPYAVLYANADVSGEKRTPFYDFIALRPKSYGNAAMDILRQKLNTETFDNIKDKDGNAFLSADLTDGKVSNKVEAGIAFYAEVFPNRVMVYATQKNVKLELGIEITADMDDDEYIFVDDFTLRYHYESFALNDDWDDFKDGKKTSNADDKDKASDYEIAYQNRVMILKRDLTFDKWNSLCLPVNLTKSQLQEAFSSDVMIARLAESPLYSGTIEFILADLDNAGDNDIVLRRGECVLIKPGRERLVEDGTITIGDVGKSTIEPPYFVIPRVSLTKKDIVESGVKDSNGTLLFPAIGNGNLKKFESLTYNDSGDAYMQGKEYPVNGAPFSDCRLYLCATFENQKMGTELIVPAGSYTFSKGNLYHLTDGYRQKGYSWWIEDRHDGTVARHGLTFSMSGINDNTTAIEGITVDITERDLPQAVYNLQGQAVRRGTTSLDGLARGMYIVNGKKVAVRE